MSSVTILHRHSAVSHRLPLLEELNSRRFLSTSVHVPIAITQDYPKGTHFLQDLPIFIPFVLRYDLVPQLCQQFCSDQLAEERSSCTDNSPHNKQ
ncbi:hypothetical protein T265_16054, partial [Opisthorchis viverrini]